MNQGVSIPKVVRLSPTTKEPPNTVRLSFNSKSGSIKSGLFAHRLTIPLKVSIPKVVRLSPRWWKMCLIDSPSFNSKSGSIKSKLIHIIRQFEEQFQFQKWFD